MDTTYSDLILMIGGQLLILFILVIVSIFGTKPLVTLTNAFPAPTARANAATASNAAQ
jgi:hypothetical protein